jgi:hypothetical protein
MARTEPGQEASEPGRDRAQGLDADDPGHNLPPLWPPPYPTAPTYATDMKGLSFGWSANRKGAWYRIVGGVIGKTLHRFPLTEVGWHETWAVLAHEYPELAMAVAIQANRDGHVVAARHEHEREEFAAYAELQSRKTPVLLAGCVLLGGYGFDNTPLKPGLACDLRFTEDEFWVSLGDTWRPFIRVAYSASRALEFAGPGMVRKGGSFFGGGFGIKGAAEGMIVASVLNSLTASTEIQTIVRYQSTDLEAFFFCSSATPQSLRIRLSAVLAKIDVTRTAPAAPESHDAVSELERLGRLREQGVLSEEEFVQLKARIISQF